MNILIVDDEKNIRSTLSDVLEDEGYRTYSVGTGEKALSLLSKEVVDMVILDVKLPGIDGIEVYRQMKNTYPDLDVLMISGHSDIKTAVKAVKLGAYDFLEKPLSMAKILTAARNIDEKRKLITRVKQEKADQITKYKLVGNSPQILKLKELISKVARTDSKVLIRGESGTGKELVAYAIHQMSRRIEGPFVKFNSAAIPNELVESELFGYEKGAFTDAHRQKLGKLELAHGGTLFLDEIGDMNLTVQAKILRVIQEGTFERVGGSETIEIDVRIIAATHRNLEDMIKDGLFREDLYYRLNVVPISIPPLRDRVGDVETLVEYFLEYFAQELKVGRKRISQPALDHLTKYHFPGNVRELKNLIERLYILVSDDIISENDIRQQLIADEQKYPYSSLEIKNFSDAKKEFEISYLTKQLERFGWNITVTAKHLGMQQPNLSRKLKELGIKKKR